MKFNEPNKYGYHAPVIKPEDYVFGDNKLGDVPINPSGQWDAYLPDDNSQLQNLGNYERFCCVSEATLHSAEILQRKKCGDTTKYSVRFLSTVSGTGPKKGNDGGTVAQKLKDGGCVQETDWPFNAATYEAFYTQPPANIIRLAKTQFSDNSFGHSWLTDTSPAGMMKALTYSPPALGVYAWFGPDANGIYHRPPGTQDCHCVTVYGYEAGQYWKIFDSYDQTHKKLAWDYGFGVGKRFTLDRVIPTAPSPAGWINWPKFIEVCRKLFKLGDYARNFGSVRSSQWPAVRAAHILKEPFCQLCGGTTSLQVHHIRPFHIHPELELDDSNLITLCTGNNTINCHVRFGHADNFRTKWNPNIREDCILWKARFDAVTEQEIFPNEVETSV